MTEEYYLPIPAEPMLVDPESWTIMNVEVLSKEGDLHACLALVNLNYELMERLVYISRIQALNSNMVWTGRFEN